MVWVPAVTSASLTLNRLFRATWLEASVVDTFKERTTPLLMYSPGLPDPTVSTVRMGVSFRSSASPRTRSV